MSGTYYIANTVFGTVWNLYNGIAYTLPKTTKNNICLKNKTSQVANRCKQHKTIWVIEENNYDDQKPAVVKDDAGEYEYDEEEYNIIL